MQNDVPVDDGKQTVMNGRRNLLRIQTIEIFENGFKHFIVVNFL